MTSCSWSLLWTGPGTLVCTASDAGPRPDDPFTGYGPAHGEHLSAGGTGLWLARQLCDHVAIRRSPHGVSVRLSTRWISARPSGRSRPWSPSSRMRTLQSSGEVETHGCG